MGIVEVGAPAATPPVQGQPGPKTALRADNGHADDGVSARPELADGPGFRWHRPEPDLRMIVYGAGLDAIGWIMAFNALAQQAAGIQLHARNQGTVRRNGTCHTLRLIRIRRSQHG
jgi:hypothetical protein